MNQPVAFTSRTTYRFQPFYFDQEIPLVSILALNRQTRKEAVSIFSGDSSFRLDQIGCLVPFMTDRTSACRRYFVKIEPYLNMHTLTLPSNEIRAIHQWA